MRSEESASQSPPGALSELTHSPSLGELKGRVRVMDCKVGRGRSKRPTVRECRHEGRNEGRDGDDSK